MMIAYSFPDRPDDVEWLRAAQTEVPVNIGHWRLIAIALRVYHLLSPAKARKSSKF